MPTIPTPPPATGVRLRWVDLPRAVRDAVEARLGGPVAGAESQPGGFSPGVAARLRSATGERVFLKAVGPEPNPYSPAAHRREARIAGALPPGTPAPPLRWSFECQGWVVLAFQDVDGRQPAQPWIPAELDRVLDAMVALWAALTPSPVPVDVAGPAAAWEPFVDGEWRQLGEAPAALRRGLDPWSARHLEDLVALETGAAGAVAGSTLLHFDLRADNLLLTRDGRVLVVDWPHARVGPPWLDALLFAPSVTMQGGPPPERLLERVPGVTGVDPQAISAALCAVAGFFTHQALRPAPPGLPTLRPFQAAQGAVAREWLARRTGWP